MSDWQLILADVRAGLAQLPDSSVHVCCTSPPYYALRAYGTEPQVWVGSDPECAHEWSRPIPGDPRGGSGPNAKEAYAEGGESVYARKVTRGQLCLRCGAFRGELGLEPEPYCPGVLTGALSRCLQCYVCHLAAVFREVRRVLHPSGTLWLNMADSYVCKPNGRSAAATKALGNDDRTFRDKPNVWRPSRGPREGGWIGTRASGDPGLERTPQADGIPSTRRWSMSLKKKDLVGMPWIVALALRADGWWLRSDVIWSKQNSMPSSIEDRPGCAHEYVFLLSKRARYHYDSFAVRERAVGTDARQGKITGRGQTGFANARGRDRDQSGGFPRDGEWRNLRSVWTISTEPTKEKHFATFPQALVRPCLLAGTSEKGCCPKCLAPWKRIVQKSGGLTGNSWTDERTLEKGTSDFGRCAPSGQTDDPYRVEHVGWQPGCKCGLDPEPCTVLDPFCGTGTTGVVALELGRHFIGIELSPRYCAIARKRLMGATSPLPELMTA